MKWQAWLPGDTNLDGKVEFKDFYTLQGNWLEGGSYNEGDFNADGRIDANDFAILQQNWLIDAGIASLSSSDFDVVPYIGSQTLLPQLSIKLNWKANLDGDRDLDAADFNRILTWYGETRLEMSTATAIPTAEIFSNGNANTSNTT